MYVSGPLAATIGWQRVKTGAGLSPALPSNLAPPGFGSQQTLQVAGSYDLTIAKLFGQYSHVRTKAADSTTTKVWSIGASVPVGAGRALAQYGSATAAVGGAEPRHNILSLGYDYSLSKRTDVYAVFMNDKITGLAAGNTFAGGMRHRF
jgi:predicted porin